MKLQSMHHLVKVSPKIFSKSKNENITLHFAERKAGKCSEQTQNLLIKLKSQLMTSQRQIQHRGQRTRYRLGKGIGARSVKSYLLLYQPQGQGNRSQYHSRLQYGHRYVISSVSSHQLQHLLTSCVVSYSYCHIFIHIQWPNCYQGQTDSISERQRPTGFCQADLILLSIFPYL